MQSLNILYKIKEFLSNIISLSVYIGIFNEHIIVRDSEDIWMIIHVLGIMRSRLVAYLYFSQIGGFLNPQIWVLSTTYKW
jgi:hypothetical protein